MSARLLLAGAALAFALALASCGLDRGRCLQSHRERYTWLMPIQVGSTPCGNGCSVPLYTYIPMEDEHDVCDRWEFPEGRK